MASPCVTSLAAAGVGIAVLADFDYDHAGTLQFVVDKAWIDVINSRYIIGIDGISLPLLAADAADRAAVHHLLLEPLPRAAQPQGVPHPAC